MPPASLVATRSAKPEPAAVSPDLEVIKTRQRVAWSSGNYAVVGTTLQIVGEELCEALDLRGGPQGARCCRWLMAMASLAAARRWCDVVSTDYVSSSAWSVVARGHRPMVCRIEFKEADAEALPFGDNSFDTVISTFGVMFTPNQDQCGGGVCCASASRGGQIGLYKLDAGRVHRACLQEYWKISPASGRG